MLWPLIKNSDYFTFTECIISGLDGQIWNQLLICTWRLFLVTNSLEPVWSWEVDSAQRIVTMFWFLFHDTLPLGHAQSQLNPFQSLKINLKISHKRLYIIKWVNLWGFPTKSPSMFCFHTLNCKDKSFSLFLLHIITLSLAEYTLKQWNIEVYAGFIWFKIKSYEKWNYAFGFIKEVRFPDQFDTCQVLRNISEGLRSIWSWSTYIFVLVLERIRGYLYVVT
jgi:hypothetical protein